MKMNSTTRAKSSLVALVVLALIFVGFSAVAYPTLSSEGDEPGRETDKDGRTYDLDGNENEDVLIRGIGGYILMGDGEPVQGAHVTLAKKVARPLPTDNTDPQREENGEYRKGTRGEGDGQDNRQKNGKQQSRPGMANDDRPRPDRDDKSNDKRPLSDDEPVRNPRKLVTKTDRIGFFQFKGIERGEYLLEALIDGKVVHSEIVKYSGEGSKPMNILLRSPPETFVVKGRVVDEKKRPVAGARVQLIRDLRDPLEKDIKPVRPNVDIDADRIKRWLKNTDDPTGQKNMELPNEGREQRQEKREEFRERRECWENREEPSERREGEESRERPSERKEQRQENVGRPNEVPGRPAPGNDKRPFILPPPVRKTTTDKNGDFGFKEVKEGGYTLIVEAKGFKPYKTLLRVHEDTKILIQLKHQPIKQLKFHIHATPVDGDGDGIFDDVMIQASASGGKALGGVMISIDGEYIGSTSFEGWLLSLDYERGMHKVMGVYKNHKAGTSFSVRGNEPPAPAPREFGYLKGIVYSDDDPVAGAIIELFNDDFHAESRAGRKGEFFFERILEGEYLIFAFAEGYHEYKDEIRIEGGEGTEIRIFLEPFEPEPPVEYGALSGSVFTDDGNPVIHAEVRIHNDRHRYATETDEDGKFEFEAPAGEYFMVVKAEGFRPFKDEVCIEVNGVKEIKIILEKEPVREFGSLHGSIVDEKGDPIIRAKGFVVAYHEVLDIVYETEINVYGKFLIQEMVTGEYTITIKVEGFRETTVTTEIMSGETTQITVQLHPRGG